MANGTRVFVTKVEMEARDGEVILEVKAVRVPFNIIATPPDALDVPQDFRTALAEWLDTGNEV